MRLKEEISIRDKQVEAFKENIDKIKKEMKSEIDENKRIISQKDEEIYGINTKIKNMINEIDTLKQKINTNNMESDEIQRLKSEIKIKNEKIDDLNLQVMQESHKNDRENKEKQKEVIELREKNSNLEEEISKVNNLYKSLLLEKQNIRQIDDINIKKLDEMNEILIESNKKYEEYRKFEVLFEESKKKNYDLNEEIKNERKEKIEMSEIINQIKNENVIINKENKELKIKLEKEKVKANEYEKEISKLKIEMKEAEIRNEKELKLKLKEKEKMIDDIKKEIIIKEDSYMLKINKALSEKKELQEMIVLQDIRLSDLFNNLNQIEPILKKKNGEIRQIQSYSETLIDIIEKQKTEIHEMKEERKLISNIETELIYLKNYNSSLKDDSKAKEEIIRQLKSKLARKNKIPHDEKKYYNILLNSQSLNVSSQIIKEEERIKKEKSNEKYKIDFSEIKNNENDNNQYEDDENQFKKTMNIDYKQNKEAKEIMFPKIDYKESNEKEDRKFKKEIEKKKKDENYKMINDMINKVLLE